jgi:hypothetical protein
MPRPQLSLRTLLWSMVVAAAFFAGIQFERERRNREDDEQAMSLPPGVIRLERPFTRVYPVKGPDGDMRWVTEPPDGFDDETVK